MNGSTFSVVIPAYNCAHLIGATIESVLNQTVRPVEIIVVDDGSTDNTRDAVARYAPDVSYVWQENAERGAARNNGAARARGSHVAFLDHDDRWHSEHLERVREAITAETPFAYTRAAYVFPDGARVKVRKRYHSGWVTKHIIRGNFVGISTAITSVAAFKSAGGFSGDRKLSGSEDWELWTRLSLFHPFTHVPYCTTQIGVHAQRTSYNPLVMERAKLAALEWLFTNPRTRDALQPYRAQAWFFGYLFVALAFYRADDQKSSRKYLERAFTTWPPGIADPRFLATLVKSYIGRRTVERVRGLLGVRRG